MAAFDTLIFNLWEKNMHFLQSCDVFMASFPLHWGGGVIRDERARYFCGYVNFLKLKTGLVYVRRWGGGCETWAIIRNLLPKQEKPS